MYYSLDFLLECLKDISNSTLKIESMRSSSFLISFWYILSCFEIFGSFELIASCLLKISDNSELFASWLFEISDCFDLITSSLFEISNTFEFVISWLFEIFGKFDLIISCLFVNTSFISRKPFSFESWYLLERRRSSYA